MNSAAIVAIVAACIAVIGVIVQAILAYTSSRRAEKWKARAMDPPDWPTAWARMDLLESKLVAAVRLLNSARDQWPAGAEPPVFDPEDLAMIEDTLPARYRTLPRPRARRA